jgi:hypothetical protein
MGKEPEKPKTDELEEAKRIMGRLVNAPHKLHKDESPHGGAAKVPSKPNRKRKD